MAKSDMPRANTSPKADFAIQETDFAKVTGEKRGEVGFEKAKSDNSADFASRKSNFAKETEKNRSGVGYEKGEVR